MITKTLFSISLPYREDLQVTALLFGKTEDGRVLGLDATESDVDELEKSICFVGGIRGNEAQQTFICARLVHKLRQAEKHDDLLPGKLIMAVPCVNVSAMNVGKRFWMGDDTDVNRMFPGYDLGETTQRIAGGLFEAVQGFTYGVHFSSYYLGGTFTPHARIMLLEAGCNEDHGADFGLPYVTKHVPGSFDTTTLHYNWRLWDTEAYTLYTMRTETVDTEAAAYMVRACLRFMDARGIIKHPCHRGMLSTEFSEHALIPVFTEHGGFFVNDAKLGDFVAKGERMAQIIGPITGEVTEEILAPCGGVVFYIASAALVYEKTLLFQIVPRNVNDPVEQESRGNFLDPEA